MVILLANKKVLWTKPRTGEKIDKEDKFRLLLAFSTDLAVLWILLQLCLEPLDGDYAKVKLLAPDRLANGVLKVETPIIYH